jgi:hypothetical protein
MSCECVIISSIKCAMWFSVWFVLCIEVLASIGILYASTDATGWTCDLELAILLTLRSSGVVRVTVGCWRFAGLCILPSMVPCPLGVVRVTVALGVSRGG